jgi:hypothetical protein
MARKDRDMPSAPSATIVDEQTQRAAMGTPAPARTTSPASTRRFEETGAGFPEPVIEPIVPIVPIVSTDGIRKYTATDGQVFTDQAAYATYQASLNDIAGKKLSAQQTAEAAAAKRLTEKTSAFDIMRRGMKENGLEALADAAIDAIMKEETEAGRLLALRNSPAYKTRFSANAKRVANGFKAIDEATYLGLEDKYQQIAQNYGLPAKYYARGELGVQQYFDDAIAKNIDPVTFEERIVEGQKILNANSLVLDAARKFYPELNDGDFLDFILNPENALSDIKRKVSAAQIGGAQLASGLQATRTGVEDLLKAGATVAGYQAKASDIAGGTLRGGQLASIYGEDPYTQQQAEQVALNLPGSAEALKQTKKVIGLERASFGGGTGLTAGALSRDRAGAN